jgi:heme-degrading monooxygenase HmoA
MKSAGPGFVVIYRWRLHPEREQSFVEAWSARTQQLRKSSGSLGSRLHRGGDGVWYAYAQWESAEHRQSAFAQPSDPALRAQMNAAVVETYPELILESVADYLVLTPAKNDDV